VKRIFSSGTHSLYILLNAIIACSLSPPIKTLSGLSKSFIAVPSAKNSGLDNTSKLISSLLEFVSAEFNIFSITSAVLTGKVLFSTTIVYPFEYLATSLALASTHFKSLDFPAPRPFFFVGVFTEIKIVNDDKKKILKFREVGKILVRGPQVMKGYLNNEIATKNVLSKDGWFDTGDLGFLIPNGSLFITGRAKDTIVLSSGENIEPNPLETEILSSEFINQIQLVGQDKKCLTALVVPNVELVKSKFLEEDLLKLNLNKNIGTFFKSQINNLLKSRLGARSEEQILDCYFVDAFTLENGLLTQTLKQKRKEIEKKYSLQIENMYENKFNKKI